MEVFRTRIRHLVVYFTISEYHTPCPDSSFFSQESALYFRLSWNFTFSCRFGIKTHESWKKVSPMSSYRKQSGPADPELGCPCLHRAIRLKSPFSLPLLTHWVSSACIRSVRAVSVSPSPPLPCTSNALSAHLMASIISRRTFKAAAPAMI